MYFLVDHENVNNSGYQGVEYLLPEDTIEIFYSESSKNIHNGIFRLIKDSGCDIKICKLKQVRKNALDFYIVSRLGELIGSGYQGNSAIISGDHGFKSVQEYWRNCTKHKRRIGLALSVADAIIAMNGDTSKEEIAFAQSYFAVQSRKQELIEERIANIERAEARNRLKQSEKRLSQNIYERGVDDTGFARIRSKGDQALFGGYTTTEMKRRLGVKENAKSRKKGKKLHTYGTELLSFV